MSSSDSRRTPPAAAPGGRDSSLDAARGIFMILGIFLHAANIYSVDGKWLVSDPQQHIAFDYIGGLIHVFRMPAFFWISGYFCALVVEKRGIDAIMRVRIPRLLLPLVAAWLLLNAPQLALVTWWNKGDPLAAAMSGVPLYHLWFLLDLIIITLAFGFAGKTLSTWLGRLPIENLPLLMVALTMGTYAFSLAARATGIAYESIFGLTSLYRIAQNSPFFIAGLLMYYRADLRAVLLRVPVPLVLVAVPGAMVLHGFSHGNSGATAEIATAGELLLTWISVAGLLRAFTLWFEKPSKVTSFLSDSAYSIYLFHHGIVILLGILLLPFAWGPTVKYVFICTATALLAGLVHVVFIRRYRWASRLFNGK